MWLLVIMALLTMIYAVVRPIFRKKDPLDKPPSFGSLAQQRAVEKQMQNVLVDLSEMARQISAQLDTRSTKLELLIREADQKLAALKSAMAQEPPMRSSPEKSPVRQTSMEEEEIIPQVDPQHVEVYTLADQGRTPYQIAQQLNRPSGEIELILALRR